MQSTYQCISYYPLERLENYFHDELEIPLSSGTLFNFDQKAYDLLEVYDSIIIHRLLDSEILHEDETLICLNEKTILLNTLYNETYSYNYPHSKRGSEAIDEIVILKHLTGFLSTTVENLTLIIHDNTLYIAHLLRELELCIEYESYKWAESMKKHVTNSLTLVKTKEGTV